MKLLFHKNFLKSVKKLPLVQQRKLSKLLLLLSRNPFHPFLHTKYLRGELAGFLSFRISREWRTIFRFLESDTIQLFRVKHRKDIYRKK